MMKKRKGFTLIELLAVLVILTVIGLIVVPIIMKTIEDAKKGSYKNSAHGIIQAAENLYAKKVIYQDTIIENIEFKYKDGAAVVKGDGGVTLPKLDFKGLEPTSGSVTIDKDGNIEIAIVYDKYCITKVFTEDIININDLDGECEIPNNV